MTEIVYTCPNCFAQTRDGPPHGWNEPCPLKVDLDRILADLYAAQTSMYEAQRMSHIRTGQGVSDMTGALRRMVEDDE